MTGELLERIVEYDALADLDPAARRLALRSMLMPHAPGGEVGALVEQLCDRIDGFGPLSTLMRDDAITDILVNAPDDIWIERSGRLETADAAFEDCADLARFVDRMLADAGARADAASPIADGRLSDGSRIHVVLPPIAPDGPLVSIRRFPSTHFELGDLIERSMMTRTEGDALVGAVADRTSILISGATGSGKTTLLNALLSCVGRDQRVVLVEEIPEVVLPGPNFVRLTSRPANVEGRGRVDLAELVRASLRMRPDRIVVGEVRGAEALAALGALATGHEGSMLTVHAGSARDAVERIVTLALGAGGRASEDTLRRQVSASFGLVVHLQRDENRRRVEEMIAPV